MFGNPLLTAKNSSEPVRDTQAEKTGWQRHNRRGWKMGGGREEDVSDRKKIFSRKREGE